eukprot:scaffold113170_cov21-Tisochrysis_lutea.AAC.1
MMLFKDVILQVLGVRWMQWRKFHNGSQVAPFQHLSIFEFFRMPWQTLIIALLQRPISSPTTAAVPFIAALPCLPLLDPAVR